MKCFYHSADLDGHSSGAIVKTRYPEAELIGYNYKQPFPLECIGSDETVFMVDVSLDIADMVCLAEACGELIWIDHHKSIISEFNALTSGSRARFSGVLEVGRAACELTWGYCFPDQAVPPVIQLLGMYDTWRWKNADQEKMALDWQYGMRRFEDTRPENSMNLWECLLAADSRSETYKSVMRAGKVCHEYQVTQNTKHAAVCAFATLLPYGPGGHLHAAADLKVVAMNCALGNSKAFDSVYDPEEHEAMLMFYWSRRGFWRCSIYSDHPDVDCSVYAKSYGGGGHKGAAGFQVDVLPFGMSAAEQVS